MHKKAFTLLEILIVVVLFGLLAGIILQTYTTISQIGFRLQQEKEISKEALIISQVLENIAQTHTIEYNKYDWKELNKQNGIVDTLYLKDNDGTLRSLSSECSPAKDPSQADLASYEKRDSAAYNTSEYQALQEKIKNADCSLIMTEESERIPLLENKAFRLTQIKFKIIPAIGIEQLKDAYQTSSQAGNTPETDQLPESGQPGFWLLGTLYSKYYEPKRRSNNISLPLQLFFSLQGNLPSLYSESTTNDAS
ncbi:MAG: type II secretion system protein [bacterium]|nr:type II secretion system protein [bacterium]